MDLSQIDSDLNNKIHLVAAYVPGKQVTLAHVMSHPDKVLFEKLGLLDMGVDPAESAIAVLTLWPAETSPIAAEIAYKTAGIDLAFVDYRCGTLIFTGKLARVKTGLSAICEWLRDHLGYSVCDVSVS